MDVAGDVTGVIRVEPGEAMTRDYDRPRSDVMVSGPNHLALARACTPLAGVGIDGPR